MCPATAQQVLFDHVPGSNDFIIYSAWPWFVLFKCKQNIRLDDLFLIL